MQAVILSAELILILLVGYFAQKCKLVQPGFGKTISAFVMKIALPCMIVNSMNVPHAMEKLKANIWILAVSAGVLVFSFLVGLLISKLLKKKLPERIVRFGAMFTNFNFFGLVVVEQLGGEELLFYYLIYIIPVRLSIYILAKVLLMPPESKQGKTGLWAKLKLIISPPLVAVFVGLALSAFNVKLPVVVQYGLDKLGGMAATLGILQCGATLGSYPVKRMVSWTALALTVLRNLLMPALVFLGCRLCGLPEMYTQLAVIYSALPVASLTSTYVVQYDPDPEHHLIGAGFVFLSTLLCAATLTLFLNIL